MSSNFRSRIMPGKAALNSSSSILFLLGISGLAILALVVLAAVWASRESDAAALERQRQLVNDRLFDQVEQVEQEIQLIGAGYGSLLGSTPRDGATGSNAGPGYQPDATETFGNLATTVFGYDAAYLVDASGEPVLDYEPAASKRYSWVRPLLQPMLRDLADESPGPASRSTRLSRVALMRLEGRPSAAGVIRVTRSTVTDRQVDGARRRLYLFVFRFLDGETLDAISREQGLSGARYARTADQDSSEVAFQINATATGEPIGYIIWSPDLPGSRVISRMIPMLSIAGVIVAGVFMTLMMRLQKSLKKLAASEVHARHLSAHDALTGLPNRLLFSSRFEAHLTDIREVSRPSAVGLLDLDKFKEVNDKHGHAAGDELLRAVAERIKAVLRPLDMLARIGGDEFALLMVGTDGNRHVELCREIVLLLQQPFYLQTVNAAVNVGCSVGVALLDEVSVNPSELLRRADVALYEAKTTGRGRVIVYDVSLDTEIEQREGLKDDLRRLLQNDREQQSHALAGKDAGHLEVHFQGIQSARSSKLSGAEALVRWWHPKMGMLSPDKFIPIAEEVGLICRLGELVLRSAVETAAYWPSHLMVAVNVSPSQIRQLDFAPKVMEALALAGLAPSRLELEITEAALFNVDDVIQDNLSLLRSQGVKIALDDFGTGYSSLSHLVQLNIDRIKIDRSFVNLIGTRAEGAAIVSSVLGLSHKLGKQTTAEGVETEGQRDFLIASGCTDLQGFLFSRPLPAAEFTARLGNPPTRLPA